MSCTTSIQPVQLICFFLSSESKRVVGNINTMLKDVNVVYSFESLLNVTKECCDRQHRPRDFWRPDESVRTTTY